MICSHTTTWVWRLLWLGVWGILLTRDQAVSEPRFQGVDGHLLPFETDEEVVGFLRSAAVISIKPVGSGVTGARKVLLDRDGLRVHAVFRDVRIESVHELPTGTKIPFRDDCIFECAAYELSLMLGLNIVPPTIERNMKGTQGTLQIWIEGGVTDSDRKRDLRATISQSRLERLWAVMALFDNLIYNDDRNRNNYLYDAEGRLWLIDHTRAFLTCQELPYPSAVTQSDPKVVQRLKELDPTEINKRLGPFLRADQIEALLVRRGILISYLEARDADN